jgi:cytochrome c peroxidase
MKRWLSGCAIALAAVAGLVLAAIVLLGLWPVPADVPGLGGGGPAGAPNPPALPDLRGTGAQIVVGPGDSIQAAVDRAQPGDTVRVLPGTYHESVLVQTHSLILAGEVQDDDRPVLDGRGVQANGLLGVADYLTFSGFHIRNYTSNGATVQGVTGVVFRDLVTEDTGEYGLFPILSTDVLVEGSVTSGVSDTGIYIGQSRDIVVRNNEAFGNVSGIEIENSTDALVADNYVHDNTAGILVFILPGKTATEGTRTRVVNNRIEDNNLPNFARPEMTVSLVPPGTGILILSADSTEVTGNRISGNKSVGVAIVALTDFPGFFGHQTEWDIPVVPEDNWIHANTYEHNGFAPDDAVVEAGFIGADLLWSTAGFGNRWDEPTASRFPSPLPSSRWPELLQRAYWRVLSFVANL